MLSLIFACICLVIFLVWSFLLLHYGRKPNDLWNFPIVGNSLMMLANLHRLFDFFTELLQVNGGTVAIKGPPFSDRNFLLTSDPANVLHITTTKLSIFSKGEEWKKRFEIFGSTLLNTDFEEGKNHRAIVRTFLSHQKFQQLMSEVLEDSMNKKLIPNLEHVCTREAHVDFAAIIKRHVLYIACRILTGIDLTSSIFPFTFHENLLPEAMSNVCEAIFARHLLPECLWKLEKWLGIGTEGKLYDGWTTIDNVVAEQILFTRKEMKKRVEEEIYFNALELNLTGFELLQTNISISDHMVRDNIVGLFFAMETVGTVLPWFFWLISKHPTVEEKIKREIRKYVGQLKWLPYGAKELKKLVYLHAVFCETLRLYPPIPLEARTSGQDDILPSGHQIGRGQNVMMSAYAMGRTSSIWGEDCHEFKPERWISDDGEIKHAASHKFFAFMAGPRICPGKDVGFTLMKIIAIGIIHNYHIEVLENHVVTPKLSIFLHMKQGLMVRVKKKLLLP